MEDERGGEGEEGGEQQAADLAAHGPGSRGRDCAEPTVCQGHCGENTARTTCVRTRERKILITASLGASELLNNYSAFFLRLPGTVYPRCRKISQRHRSLVS